mmetsp:Transcript_661/g.1487  ORF Transcript_661/g.1487 Transcript_661/m.1487 type:complete len:609 (-) Transcript_661:188-2014(-)
MADGSPGNPNEISPKKVTMGAPERKHQFKGRTVSIVNDLTPQEQMYLYRKTRELKQAVQRGEDINGFRLQNNEAAVYTIFMEDSTRTKESFRNAAEFHGMKVNVFDAKTSSFQKNETITDTIKMLCGYSIGQSIFVIRSKMEGVCTWLGEAITEYCEQRGFAQASFINAGDGKHEHPSQEFLDEFSFLEAQNVEPGRCWDTESIHLALLGDLYHGRTVHSKVDGLRIYNRVFVDLIAPKELAMPRRYVERMRELGYLVREFASIEDYLQQDKVASMWYFTRLQLERMGEDMMDRSAGLRKAVTMAREYLPSLPPNTKFFHPLPRDARFPTLPFWLDSMQYNGWDVQSQNGYFTRITLLGMLGGQFGDDFEPCAAGSNASSPQPGGMPARSSNVSSFAVGFSKDANPVSALSAAKDFIQEVAWTDKQAMDSVSDVAGLVPISNGIAIKDIGKGEEKKKIWSLMYMIRWVLSLNGVGGQGMYRCQDANGAACHAGFITVPNFDIEQWDRGNLKRLAAIAPGGVLQVVRDGAVCKEFNLLVPPRIYNFENISCKNKLCISYPANMQHEVPPYFLRDNLPGVMAFTCKYCEARHNFWEVWDYKYYERPEYTL